MNLRRGQRGQGASTSIPMAQELDDHQCLGYLGLPAQYSGWRYRVGNKEVTTHVSGKCRANNSEVLPQMALGGAGIVMFPT